MKRCIVYSLTTLAIIVVVVLASSGEYVPCVIAVVMTIVMRFVFTSRRGRKWWLTWYRVGLEFDMFLRESKKK